MARSDKQTNRSRIELVKQLISRRATFSEIRKLSDSQGWDKSDRQLRRYVVKADQDFAKETERDRKALLGRHQQQRDDLYRQAYKDGQLNVALNVLKDQAKLQNLYPPGRQAGGSVAANDPLKNPGPASSLPRRERATRIVAAESRGDVNEVRFLTEAMPSWFCRLPDTTVLLYQLHILERCYLSEQLDHLGIFFAATGNVDRSDGPLWNLLARMSAYRIIEGEAGWNEFLRSLGIEMRMLSGKAQRMLLEMWHERIVVVAPTRQQLADELQANSLPAPRLVTAADLAKGWRRAFGTFDD